MSVSKNSPAAPRARGSASLAPTLGGEDGLNAYLAEIKKFPLLAPEQEYMLAKRYAELFGIFVQHHDVIDRVTFWGVTDGDSWLNNYPTRGRTNYPLLFDRSGKPKSAFDSVLQQAKTR